MNATIKIVVVPDKTLSGLFPVKLRVTYLRKVRYFPLSRYVSLENWDAGSGRFLRGHPEWKAENEVLRSYEQRAADAIRAFELDHTFFTFDRFREKVFGSGASGALTVCGYVRTIERELWDNGSLGNSAVYRDCAQTVESFRPSASLSDIDAAWLQAFERFMRKRGAKDGGVSLRLRTLRASCRTAARTGVMQKGWKPFDDYSLSHLKASKLKKALDLETIKRFDAEGLPFESVFGVDMFLLSFNLRGMNLADIADLTRANVKEGRIVYERNKTGRAYSIAINDRVAALLEKYKRPGDPYLFPIYRSDIHKEPIQRIYRLKRVAKIVNGGIRAAARHLGIDTENLSFYSARHSYATALQRAGVNYSVISEALGHSSIKTTEIYLKGFGQSAVDDADRMLE